MDGIFKELSRSSKRSIREDWQDSKKPLGEFQTELASFIGNTSSVENTIVGFMNQ